MMKASHEASASTRGTDLVEANSRYSFTRLSAIFWTWKALLLLIAVTSPGPGYDTSTSLLELGRPDSNIPRPLVKLVKSLVRWDAIYFTQMAQRGHLYEQEWAFGMGISSVLSWLTRGVFRSSHPQLWQIAITGLLLSHLTHFLATLLVWRIAKLLINDTTDNNHLPFITTLIYILSPAGVFLSAPYTESLFAFCNLTGTYLYLLWLKGTTASEHIVVSLLPLFAGVFFGFATFVRSNGILSGTFFAVDALQTLREVMNKGVSQQIATRFLLICCGGVIVATGMIVPQYLAFREYCLQGLAQDRRSWCSNTIPSIFTFAQAHYWNVGLFRYWTVSNLPLFALASPVLHLMMTTSISNVLTVLQKRSSGLQTSFNDESAFRLALPEGLLALSALTSYHVQIITRISSGYILWYLYLATSFSNGAKAARSKLCIRFIILYGLIQAALFSSFLPPA